MFSVDKAPRYAGETLAAAARLQEQASPDRYEALVERARRLLDGMFTVDVNLDPDLMIKIALREKFEAPRVKQAILMVATWKLIHDLAESWSVKGRPAPAVPSRKLAAAAH